jgi:surface carbohydrate biosynthesis protein
VDAVKQPIVYLPIEFRSREFDSKALLAAVLAERGYPVVLGQQWMVFANLGRLPPGVMLFKSFNRIHHQAMRDARRAGHRVVALEEELLAQTEERVIRMLCPAGLFESADLFLVHGEFEREIVTRLAGAGVRVEIGGNGRVDILKPAGREFFREPIERIRAQYGDFVLVNTNFSTVNSAWRSVEKVTQLEIDAGFLNKDDPEAMRRWQGFVAYEGVNRDAMHAAIRELVRRRPQQKIVVRPHPGEDLAGWNGVFPGAANVHIVREGSHVAWTLACRALVHSSCTTGFEAHVAGKPALSLAPSRGWNSDSLLSNKVNPVFTDPLALVDALEKILDGGAAPAAAPGPRPAEHYVWNYRDNDGSRRIAALLAEGLPPPGQVNIPALAPFERPEILKNKFLVSPEECADTLQRIARAHGLRAVPEVRTLGESLFVVVPAGTVARTTSAPPAVDYAQLRTAIEGAVQRGEFQNAVDTFKRNFGEAQRHPELCFFTGVALFEMQQHALALQYLQMAAYAGDTLPWNVALWQARALQQLGKLDDALRYAGIANRLAPLQDGLFDFYKDLALRTGNDVPAHWIVIGCSHVRYFRYMQINPVNFFGDRVHLECYMHGGATAFGLTNPDSQAGVLRTTQRIAQRLPLADRVVVHFGEVDCRRAAWKAAAVAGQPIEAMIAESVAHLEAYVTQQILPRNRNVLLLGAKPQIVSDGDFYKNAQDDERIVFQPLAERERVTRLFNEGTRRIAEKHGLEYADIHHVLASEESRREFFKQTFWDGFTTDTHGNIDYLSRVYYERLREFAGG